MKLKKIDALWAHVHWLAILSEEASFTAAATRLGVSKAAMSHRIAELEEAAGVSLVSRTTRSVRLTEAGQQLVEETHQAFSLIESSFSRVKERSRDVRGTVRISAPSALGRQFIVPHTPALLQQHPALRVELELSERLVSLSQEGFDLAIRHVDSVPDSYVAWRLCDTQAVLVATPAYLRERGTPLDPHALRDHDCLHYQRNAPEPTWSFRRKGRSERLTVPVRGPFTANNSEALRELACAGAGIALLPDFSAAEVLKARRVVRVLPEWQIEGAAGAHIFAVRPFISHVPRAVKVTIDHFRTALGQGFSL